MGRCNVGCLVQNLMDTTDRQISKMVNHDIDEWSEHANDYCHGTNQQVDDLFKTLNNFGLSYQDIMHIEYLNDPKILSKMPGNCLYLTKNDPKDVSAYLRCAADQRELALQQF